jgi:prepilin-type N-terminal cleavage/methylation domain-containing protein
MVDSFKHELRRGLTLAELVVVLAILAMLGSLLLPAVGHLVGDSRGDVTRASLARLREVVAGLYWPDANGQLPQPNASVSPGRVAAPQSRYLFVNPATEDATVTFDPVYKLGWRGPYVVQHSDQTYTINQAAGFTQQYGETGDPAVCDGWGQPIVIQNPGLLPDGRQDVRLVSAGPDGVIDTPSNVLTANLSPAPGTPGNDDIVVSFGVR